MSLNRQGTEHLLNRIYTTIGAVFIEKNMASNEAGVQLMLAQANEILLGWLTYILDPNNCGRIAVNGLKVALSTLVKGKPVDKFTCEFYKIFQNLVFLYFATLFKKVKLLLALSLVKCQQWGQFSFKNFKIL